MSKDYFFTIKKKCEGLYKEKGSKFIGIAIPVLSEEDIKSSLLEIKTQYYDARHHCYAWVLGNNGTAYRANDDGEPNHSAGDPILGQIRSSNLTNLLIVVVRYFGGTKLGVSGLINAYRTAAADAIKNGKIVKEKITFTVTLTFDYGSTNSVMRFINSFNINIIEQVFELNCKLTAALSINEKERFLNEIKELSMRELSLQYQIKDEPTQ